VSVERQEASARRLLGVCATGAVAGIALSVADWPGVGGGLVVASLALMLYALHRLGRSGADAPHAKRKRKRRTKPVEDSQD